MQPYNMRKRIVEGDIAIVGDRPDVQEALIDINVSLMIITGSNSLSDYLHEKAVKAGITVISTPHDSFETSRLIVQSIPVEYLMAKENLVSFSTDELVEDVKKIMVETSLLQMKKEKF